MLRIKENTLENIYNAIKNDIKSHPNISLSLLGQVPEWKRSQFVILSDIISDDLATSSLLTHERKINLGSTISPITLQRFFENDYQVKTHNDLRFIKTLDKICVFLGKFDLNAYIHDRVHELSKTPPKSELEMHLFEKDLIFNYCKAHFDAFHDLPSINVNKICEYVFKDSPFCERIRISMEDKRKNNLSFVTENNRSNYEIFEMIKISDDSDLKVIKTQEFWNLLFTDGEDNEFIVNHLNTQFYFLKKLNEEWKIWDNYNPDHQKILKIKLSHI